MSFEFKVYLNNGREFFMWNTENSKPIKKDFEFSQSLLDFLDLDMMNDETYNLFQKMGKEIQNLYEKTEEKKDVSFLKNSFNKISKLHIYFEYLRLDWCDRLDKYLNDDYTSAVDLMYYKKITHIPMNIQTMQNQIRGIFSNVLDVLSPDKPFQKKMVEYYEGKYLLDIFDFRPQSTNFEIIDKQTFAEVLYPKDIYDMIDFFLRAIIKQELTFKQCKSCGRYFPATGHGNSEYCNRLFQDTGKTCKEIGSAMMYQAKVESNPAIQAYNRAYKTHFARIKYKKMTKEEFQIWAKDARNKRDLVIGGKLTLENYQQWLKD